MNTPAPTNPGRTVPCQTRRCQAIPHIRSFPRKPYRRAPLLAPPPPTIPNIRSLPRMPMRAKPRLPEPNIRLPSPGPSRPPRAVADPTKHSFYPAHCTATQPYPPRALASHSAPYRTFVFSGPSLTTLRNANRAQPAPSKPNIRLPRPSPCHPGPRVPNRSRPYQTFVFFPFHCSPRHANARRSSANLARAFRAHATHAPPNIRLLAAAGHSWPRQSFPMPAHASQRAPSLAIPNFRLFFPPSQSAPEPAIPDRPQPGPTTPSQTKHSSYPTHALLARPRLPLPGQTMPYQTP